jgi:hypothetical protein
MEIPLTDYVTQVWPMIQASPGPAVLLMLGSALVGYIVRAVLGRHAIAGLREQVKSKDDRIEGYRERNTDLTAKYGDLAAQLSTLQYRTAKLNDEVARGLPQSVLMSTTASVVENVSSVTAASGNLGTSVSALLNSPLYDTPLVLRTGTSPLYAARNSTSPPAASPPSPAPPASPTGKSP